MKFLATIFLLLCLGECFSQANNKPIYEVITAPSGSFTTWTFLPKNYDNTKDYPALVFVSGSGEIRTGTRSTDSTRMRRYGPGLAILNGSWDGKALVRNADGSVVDTSIILSIIQPPSNQTTRSNGSRIADSLFKRYSIDTMRKVWSGLSMGGQMGNQILMIYSNSSNPNITWEHFTNWSAAFIFSTPFPTSGGNISNLRFWLDKGSMYYYGKGSNDPYVVIEPEDLDSLKNAYPGQVFTFEYPGEGHDSWNNRYTRSSFYDSLFLFDKYPKAVAPVSASTSASEITLSATVWGYYPVGVWTRVSGPNVPTITPTGVKSNVTITNMAGGTHVFRLRVTNGNGASASYWDHFTTVNVTSGIPASKKVKLGQKGRRNVFKTN